MGSPASWSAIPKTVLADESAVALNQKSGRNMVDTMPDRAKQQGCTILLVTHDNRILDIADRIVYRENGRLSIARRRLSN